jgi:hypothetical protein
MLFFILFYFILIKYVRRVTNWFQIWKRGKKICFGPLHNAVMALILKPIGNNVVPQLKLAVIINLRFELRPHWTSNNGYKNCLSATSSWLGSLPGSFQLPTGNSLPKLVRPEAKYGHIPLFSVEVKN